MNKTRNSSKLTYCRKFTFFNMLVNNYSLSIYFLVYNYRIEHFFFLPTSGGCNAATIASSKTFFKPFY